jgi:7-cyano-7-deazaguanine synthase
MMSLVTLVSGGLDSTLVAVMAREEGITQFPLFIDYGQICRDQEWQACISVHSQFGLPTPAKMNLSGFGELIFSGLTNRNLRVNEDAFLPGRNLLFLLAGAVYAYQSLSNAVAIGLLSEETHLFPDQTSEFVKRAQETINFAIGSDVRIVAPLINLTKRDVLELARQKGIVGTYSCHAGTFPPCGRCVSCQEVVQAEIST